MSNAAATVFIVDDDPQVCESLSLMVHSTGLNARTYRSAEAFLDSCRELPKEPKCLVLDVRMPGLNGLDLQQVLSARGQRMPTIMISGSADIPMAVQAMSAGAMDFLEKPFNREVLLSRIREAIDHDARRQRETARSAEVAARLKTLSTRQREVLDLLVAGKHAKQIANELGIGEKTVAKHRADSDRENAGRQRGRSRPLDGRRESRVECVKETSTQRGKSHGRAAARPADHRGQPTRHRAATAKTADASSPKPERLSPLAGRVSGRGWPALQSAEDGAADLRRVDGPGPAPVHRGRGGRRPALGALSRPQCRSVGPRRTPVPRTDPPHPRPPQPGEAHHRPQRPQQENGTGPLGRTARRMLPPRRAIIGIGCCRSCPASSK